VKSVRFAVIGDRGMFGSDMFHLLKARNQDVTGFNRDNMNLADSIESLAKQLAGLDAIVNAVAYTAVDKAESEIDLANLVNGEYAGKLAKAAQIVGAKFLHISTDYVFDGNATTAYSTNAPTNPQGAYGRSKLLGEQLVSDSSVNYVIFRTAWLYGANGRCFPKVIHQKASFGEPLKVVDDQFGQPTWTRDLAEQVLAFSLLPKSPNIVHVVSSGKTSWFGFAKQVVGEYPIEAVSSKEFVTAAKRPAFSVLDNSSDLVEPIGNWADRWEVAKESVLGS
jgi:dTDP-4-dehydrorhamnose reductase